MGISGVLLKKKEKFNFDKLISDIKIAANSANIICVDGIEFQKQYYGPYQYVTLNLRDVEGETDNDFLIYVYNDICDMIDGMFDFIDSEKNYQQCINIENFNGCKMLFDFIYEYMKLNLDDIFYDELAWHYTFEQIEKIAKRDEFDLYWAFNRPSE